MATLRGIDAAITAVCTLEDPVRRSVYRAVCRHPVPATRADVAEATGISISLAAHHLDRLVDVGLLDAFYARPAGRGGPGSGRPAKRYQLSDVEIDLTLPPRRYDLMAAILAEAMAGSGTGEDVRPAAAAAAMKAGRQVAKTSPDGWRGALEALGFSPSEEDGRILLRNCPFLYLARAASPTVCPINLALVTGILRGAGERTMAAGLDRAPGRCCVVLGTRPARRRGDTRTSR